MSKVRMVGVAGLLVVAALVGGTVIGSVAAGTLEAAAPAGTPGALAAGPSALPGADTTETCSQFRRAFAAALGVDESALGPAAKSAARTTIDAAVAAGRIATARGERLKERIDAADADGCALLAGRMAAIRTSAEAGATGRAALGVVRNGVTAAAKALGMTPAELGERLRTGGSLKDIAADKGVSYDAVSAAIMASVKADLDTAVAAGTIRQARADRILARLEARLADGRLRDTRPAAPDGGTTRPSPSPAP